LDNGLREFIDELLSSCEDIVTNLVSAFLYFHMENASEHLKNRGKDPAIKIQCEKFVLECLKKLLEDNYEFTTILDKNTNHILQRNNITGFVVQWIYDHGNSVFQNHLNDDSTEVGQ